MKRLAVGLFILISASFSGVRAGDTDFFRSDSFDHASSASVSEGVESNLSGQESSESGAGTASGTLTGYTLWRVDSKYGDILVQPVFGQVNGAQIHISW